MFDEPFLHEALVLAVIRDNDVVQELDVEEFSTFSQSGGDFKIILAGFNITTWVVVQDGDLRGITQDGNFEHLAWGHKRGIDRPDTYYVDAVDVVSGIEAEQEEYLPVSIFDEFEAECCQVLRVSDSFFPVFNGSIFNHLHFYNIDFYGFFCRHCFFSFQPKVLGLDAEKTKRPTFKGPAFCSEMAWLYLFSLFAGRPSTVQVNRASSLHKRSHPTIRAVVGLGVIVSR